MKPFLATIADERVIVIGFVTAGNGPQAVVVRADRSLNYCDVQELTDADVLDSFRAVVENASDRTAL